MFEQKLDYVKIFFKKIHLKNKHEKDKIIPGLPELVHPKSCHSIPIVFFRTPFDHCVLWVPAIQDMRHQRGDCLVVHWWISFFGGTAANIRDLFFSKLTLIWQFKLLSRRTHRYITFWPTESVLLFHIPYARHYNPRFVYLLPTFWSSFKYCDLWLYVWLVLKSRLYWRAYGICFLYS